MANNTPQIRFAGFTDPWEQRKLGDICERVTRKNKNGESDLPLTIASQHGLIDQRDFFNKIVAAKDMSNYLLLKKGEFAYNKSYSNGYDYGSIKRLNDYEQGCLSTLYICFGIKTDDVESDYLECFFDTLKWYEDVAQICAEGARNHGLLNVDTKGFFDEVTINLPSSKEEQRKISQYLNTLDNLITLHQRKLQSLQDAKKSMLQKMFPKAGEQFPELRFSGFTDPWEQRKLGDVADVTKLAGFEFTEHVVYSDTGNIIALRGLNVKNGQLVLDDVKYIDGSNLSKLSRSKLYANDIMFTYVGTVGEVAIINDNDRFYLAPNVSRIRVQSNDSPRFVSHYMRSEMFYRTIILPLIATSSQPALSMENIRKFVIDFPKKIDEQIKIAAFFDQIDNLITLHQRKHEQLNNIKKALLQIMFI